MTTITADPKKKKSIRRFIIPAVLVLVVVLLFAWGSISKQFKTWNTTAKKVTAQKGIANAATKDADSGFSDDLQGYLSWLKTEDGIIVQSVCDMREGSTETKTNLMQDVCVANCFMRRNVKGLDAQICATAALSEEQTRDVIAFLIKMKAEIIDTVKEEHKKTNDIIKKEHKKTRKHIDKRHDITDAKVDKAAGAMAKTIAPEMNKPIKLGPVPTTGKKPGGGAPSTGGGQPTNDNCPSKASLAARLDEVGEFTPEFCATVSKLQALGRACYPQDANWDTVGNLGTLCKQRNEKGFTKAKNSVQRSLRAHTTDDLQCGWGKDFPLRDCAGGDWFMSLQGAAATAGFYKGIVYENWVSSKWQDKLGGRNPVTGGIAGGGESGGPTDNDGPVDTDNGACPGCTGPGANGGTSYADTIGNSGVPINTPISVMTPVAGIGGEGVYGANHPIANGASYSGNNTLPSNLKADGSSAGMTKLSGKYGAGITGDVAKSNYSQSLGQ